MKQFRNEKKIVISPADALMIKSRLDALMQRDENGDNGNYRVRSLYFDTPSDKALREKVDGVALRDKYRLRYYGDNLDFIHLEKKSKVNGMCAKEQVKISYDQAKALVEHDHFIEAEEDQSLLQEVLFKMKSEALHPKCVVDYERTAWTFNPGNVRITLDTDLRTDYPNRFLDPNCRAIRAGEGYGILEVKWDDVLPSFIKDIVQLGNHQVSAYSKYEQSRRIL